MLSNAIKFSNIGGSVDLILEYQNEESIKVFVKDQGKGIKKQDKGKLFKLFSSIKDEKKKINIKGIGLGLVISRMIVEKFNGTIDFIS